MTLWSVDANLNIERFTGYTLSMFEEGKSGYLRDGKGNYIFGKKCDAVKFVNNGKSKTITEGVKV